MQTVPTAQVMLLSGELFSPAGLDIVPFNLGPLSLADCTTLIQQAAPKVQSLQGCPHGTNTVLVPECRTRYACRNACTSRPAFTCICMLKAQSSRATGWGQRWGAWVQLIQLLITELPRIVSMGAQ